MTVTHVRADEIPPPWQPPSDLSQSTSSCSLSLHSVMCQQMVLDTGVLCHQKVLDTGVMCHQIILDTGVMCHQMVLETAVVGHHSSGSTGYWCNV